MPARTPPRIDAILCGVLSLLVQPGPACAQVLINELRPSGGDGVELYNAGRSSVDLNGYTLVLGAQSFTVWRSLPLPAKGHLWIAYRPPADTAMALPFKLPRQGGTLLLIAPGGTAITDVFTWPDTPLGHSIGRTTDGGEGWSFFPEPSPGAPNHIGAALRGRAPAPVLSEAPGAHPSPFTVTLSADPGTRIRYSTDGSDPLGPGGQDYVAPIAIDGHRTLRARTLEDGKLPSTEVSASWTVGHPGRAFVTLSTEPSALFGDSGIYAPGAQLNHTRRGRAWERRALLHQVDGDRHSSAAVGLRLHGSGSRGLAKRSFRVMARDRYGSPQEGFIFTDGTRLRDGVLRADASPHAFLRNSLLETVVRRHGLHLAVQPTHPVPLYLNGRYWGLYRWMPAKNAAWLSQRAGGLPVDVLEGPSATVITGGSKHYRSAMGLLLRGAPADSLAARMDLESLIDLACLDLWSGRADHDLNVRCYRPRTAQGRWRWVLFDMDLWAPPEENTVQRMMGSTAPETPFVPQLLGHPVLRLQLLARMAALQATALHPQHLASLADSLYHAHQQELQMDHRRWELELDNPSPESALRSVRDFALQRPANVLRHLAAHTGHALVSVTIHAPPEHQGVLRLEGLELPPGTQRITAFAGVPMRVELEAREGHTCEGWKGADGDGPALRFDPATTRQLRPVVRTLAP